MSELLEGRLQLPSVHLRLGECADEAVAKHRHSFLVRLGNQLVHECPLVTSGIEARVDSDGERRR